MAHNLANHIRTSALNHRRLKMIRNIQALRGIFVFLIYLCHYRIENIPIMPSGGDCGVAFFMMLSGFVLCAGYEQRITSGAVNYIPFLKRRICKVYPLHLLCFFWAAVLFKCDFNLKTLSEAALNISLLQSWTLSSDYYFSFNAVSWFLCDVVFFYALFPLMCRKKLVYRSWFVATFSAICLIYICAIRHINEPLLNGLVYIFPISRLLDFIIGMLIWRLYKSCQKNNLTHKFSNTPKWVKSVCEISAIAILALCITFYSHADPTYRLAVYWWPCMTIIIIAFAFTDNNGGALSRLLSAKPLLLFGEAAFSFYMVHLLGINTFTRIVFKIGLDTGEWTRFAIITIAILILTFITHSALKHIKWTVNPIK